MKSSFTLIEIIISTIIISIVVATTFNIMLMINKKNNTTYNQTITKIDIESTRLYLQKQFIKYRDLKSLRYDNQNLFYNNALLLKNISSFEKIKYKQHIQIDFCIKNSENICTKILLKLTQ